jgi:hypothetical protein
LSKPCTYLVRKGHALANRKSETIEAERKTSNLGFELWLTADKLGNNMDVAEYLQAQSGEQDEFDGAGLWLGKSGELG